MGTALIVALVLFIPATVSVAIVGWIISVAYHTCYGNENECKRTLLVAMLVQYRTIVREHHTRVSNY